MKNKYILYDGYYIVIDSRNRQFKISSEDYNLIKDHRWYINIDGYVCTNIRCKKVKLHRFLMNNPIDMEIDHINRDKLDNRRTNLRICDKADNLKNSNKYKNNKSGVTGVSWSNSKNKWVVQIQLNGKRTHLGYFINLEDATKIRVNAELKYYGEYSPLVGG